MARSGHFRMTTWVWIGFAAAVLCFCRAWRLDHDRRWIVAGLVLFIAARLLFEIAARNI